MTEPSSSRPVFRRLRVFAVDPGMAARFETAVLNEKTVLVPWEDLAPGPVGEYLEVRDETETGTVLHPPVDLDRPDLLAEDGLRPSDGDPQFRQQMVYAVAMDTIRTFELALGRTAHWPAIAGGRGDGAYQRRLALFPHYDTMMNAYYSPSVGLCFGYFAAQPTTPFAGTVVFSCLSQDVLTHELTHALLTGMDVEFGDEKDGMALHEAFADLVALLRRFADGDVLRHQIRQVRGELGASRHLGAVALQMGQAIGLRDGIRNALGHTDDAGGWSPREPDPRAYRTTTEPHELGAILVGAVFEALRTIYQSRVADLRRIASSDGGADGSGELHPDLVRRLSREAEATARLVLRICIRALDYLPPVGITYGDFLRALLTGDRDAFPVDDRHYRVAFVDAFRSYGIGPDDVPTLSPESLMWPPCADPAAAAAVSEYVASLTDAVGYWSLPTDREALWTLRQGWKRGLEKHLARRGTRVGRLAGRSLEVRSFDLRADPAGTGGPALHWVIKLVRKRGSPAGCTLVVDADTARVRYLIEKPGAAERGRSLLDRASATVVTPPTERRLRVFASDPGLGVELETAGINEVTLAVPWERTADGAGRLAPGPAGEYVEVVDHDPASGCFYAPVDLDAPAVVAQRGLPPSESDPQFHQQMVYAVTMRVIHDFERALGRVVLWSPRLVHDAGGAVREEYVPTLRVYPHALREANAYYSPPKKALLFGYFPTHGVPGDATAGPGPSVTVFTCLSHDIVAHEVTHALLDGVNPHFNEPSNPDVLAFHEAFADLVALFEHFSLPEVLRHQIAATRGDLAGQNRLGELAQQFGVATGRRGALRSAIGGVDPGTGRWTATVPDPAAYHQATEPHERGAVLVAAVFGAFLTIYKARIADLLRIATDGSGVLPEGHLHPDLVVRLADEAASSARRVLHMCIRALDYCPPVDITFGDYLRAVITADLEHDPVDEAHDRVAVVESFRRWGVLPTDVRTLSAEGLRWRAAATPEDADVVAGVVAGWSLDFGSWRPSTDRRRLVELVRERRTALRDHLRAELDRRTAPAHGLDPGRPVEVHTVRPATGTDAYGKPTFRWVIEVTQEGPPRSGPHGEDDPEPDVVVRGGCTLLVDARTGRVVYSIVKRLDDDTRRERRRRWLRDERAVGLGATYFGRAVEGEEPFALLHRG